MKRIIIFLPLILSVTCGFSQEKAKADFGHLSVSGHLQYLENVWLQPNIKKWQTMGTLNNRLDFRWNKSNVSAHIGMRNVMNYGQMVYDYYPYMGDMATQEFGWMDLTHTWGSDSSYFFYTSIDRANVNLTFNKVEVVAGRQRINWGINTVWNPNDIFNTFNYFDFDYVERPGCDAIKVQYYTSSTSSAQFAWKIDSDNKNTIAGMYNFNKWNYDMQVFGGVMRDDIVVGGGWSGQIKSAGFNGETTYFHPSKNFSDTSATVVFSTGANYTFPSSLFIHASIIYNSDCTTGNAYMGDFVVGNRNMSAKTLTPSRMEIFGELAYQITPLIRGNIAGIINPYDGSSFIGPSLDFSLTDNIGLLLIGQLFFGNEKTEYGDYGQLAYGRLKWNF